jgi:hypothetical protein
MQEKEGEHLKPHCIVFVAVCPARILIWVMVVFEILFYYVIKKKQALCGPHQQGHGLLGRFVWTPASV